MEIIVRRAAEADLEALLPLVRAYRRFYEQEPDEGRERSFIQKHLRDASSTVFVALAGAQAVGFVQIFESWSTVRLAPVLILEDLFVDPAWRGNGIGRSLVYTSVAYARENGAASMSLETAIANEQAQRVYEREGWGRERAFIKYNAPL
jgi:ribosomal protein S18 acetylase RimI-like enzyme